MLDTYDTSQRLISPWKAFYESILNTWILWLANSPAADISAEGIAIHGNISG